jgi:hypothetical protein
LALFYIWAFTYLIPDNYSSLASVVLELIKVVEKEKQDLNQNLKKKAPETAHEKKLEKSYAPGNPKIPSQFNEQEILRQQPRGKKQRRQFKLDPNRG